MLASPYKIANLAEDSFLYRRPTEKIEPQRDESMKMDPLAIRKFDDIDEIYASIDPVEKTKPQSDEYIGPLVMKQYNSVDENCTSLNLAEKTKPQSDNLPHGISPVSSHNLSGTVTLTSLPQEMPSPTTLSQKKLAHIPQWTMPWKLATAFFIVFVITVLSLLIILLLKSDLQNSQRKILEKGKSVTSESS